MFLTYSVIAFILWQSGNVSAGMSSTSQSYSEAESSLRAAWITALVCFAFDLIGIFGALSIFVRWMNLVQSVLHLMGGLLTCWFVLASMPYQTYWTICGLFSIVPAVLELNTMLKIFVFKTIPY